MWMAGNTRCCCGDAAGMETQGPLWGGDTERLHGHGCTYDKSKGTREIRKGNVYFLAFEYMLNPVESQINSLVKSSRRGRVAPPHHGAVGPEPGERGTWGSSAGDPEGDFV